MHSNYPTSHIYTNQNSHNNTAITQMDHLPRPNNKPTDAQAGYGIWNPLLKTNLPQRLIGLQNILHAEISVIHHTLQILTQEFPNEPAHIFIDSLNSLYLINIQIKHPT
jgi:hypothetical protein